MSYYSVFKYGEALMEEGTIIPVYSSIEYYSEIRPEIGMPFISIDTGKYPRYSHAEVRNTYWEEFQSRRQKSKTFFSILHDIAREAKDYEN